MPAFQSARVAGSRPMKIALGRPRNSMLGIPPPLPPSNAFILPRRKQWGVNADRLEAVTLRL